MRVPARAARTHLSRLLSFAALLGMAMLGAPGARAEVSEVRFARQLGLGYLQFYVMQDQKLVEKHGKAQGLDNLTASYRPLGSPTALTDALLSSSVDIVGIGLPAFLTMWDRTSGAQKVMGVVALNRQPAYLLTHKAGINSIKDYTAADRIALPAPKVSVQAIMLQMIAEKQLGPGRHDSLDHLTVAMNHPDGTTAMLGGRSEVTSHFTSAPFQYQQLDAGKGIRKLLSSYDATDGPNTFSVAASTKRWHDDNPKAYRAVFAAINEANAFIAANPRKAAELFKAIENVKMPVELIERMIRDPEFSFEPAPMNVLKIQHFMQRVGTLKNKPAQWTELFFAEAHALKGN